MATTFKQLQDEVLDIIDDATQTPDLYINRAIAFISQFFQNKTISEFNPNQTAYYLDTPTRLNPNLPIQIFVNDEAVDVLKDYQTKKIQYAKEDGVQKYYNITSDKIYLTFEIKTTDDVRVVYQQNYNSALSADGDVTDVPDLYLPLVISVSVWLYYQKIVSSVITNREKYADVDPREIGKIRDSLKKEVDDMLINFQIEA